MDLNHLYSQHQLSVMRADASTTCAARAEYLAAADQFAGRIRNYQAGQGAAAAEGWLHDRSGSHGPAAQTRSHAR